MAMKTRHRAKAELEMAANNLDWTLKHLLFLDMSGYGDKDEFKDVLTFVSNAIIEIQKVIRKLKDKL